MKSKNLNRLNTLDTVFEYEIKPLLKKLIACSSYNSDEIAKETAYELAEIFLNERTKKKTIEDLDYELICEVESEIEEKVYNETGKKISFSLFEEFKYAEIRKNLKG